MELKLPTTKEEFEAALKKAADDSAKKTADQSKAVIEKLKEKVALASPPKSGGLKVKLADGIYVIQTTGNVNVYDRDAKKTTVYKAEDLLKNPEICQQIVDKGSDLIVKLNEK